MKDFKGETKNEMELFKEIQKANNSYPNGWIGTQTMSDIAITLGAKGFPYTLEMYNQPVIIGNDLLAFNPKSGLKNYKNSILGSFTHPRATTPCSILVNNGQIIFNDSCRFWAGYPEAVMYKCNDTVSVGEFISAADLPLGTQWAVGGFGLLGLWNPNGQGFKTINGTDFYNSVVYKTNHNVLGYKNGKVFGIYFKNMTAKQIDTMCKDKFKFEFAILLDGGGLAAINGDEKFAQINTQTKQGYAIQFI